MTAGALAPTTAKPRGTPAVTPAGVDRRAMATLSLGHLFTDIAQGSVPALLPFLIAENHLSYAAASALVLAATISSSIIQPLFGYVSDRLSLMWLMPLGPALGGLGIALVGFAPNYALTFAAIVVAGIGVAAFHPEGSRFANYVSGSKRSSRMSLFSVGGNIGFALGPIISDAAADRVRAPRDGVRADPDLADGRCPGPRAAAAEDVPDGSDRRRARRAE